MEGGELAPPINSSHEIAGRLAIGVTL